MATSTPQQQAALAALDAALKKVISAQHSLLEIHPLTREIKPYQALTQIIKDLGTAMQDIGRIKL